MRRLLVVLVALASAAVACIHGPHAARAEGVDDGVFRYLTQSLPVGSTNAEYVAQLLTANADGPVTYGISAGSLPNGLVLDPATGFLTGRPTTTFNANVTFRANDGVGQIDLTAEVRVNAAGGGGNEGSTFGNLPFAAGTVGTAYTHTVSVQNGVGPYVFGAASLPPGLRLDGLTGTVSGTPTAAGTFYVEFSVTDHGENENKVVTVTPLKVLPSNSSFAFLTTILDNGEIGTPYCDAWLVTGADGNVTYSASGLPPGVEVEPATGVVTGTPTAAGTFEVVIGARDGGHAITTNLTMIIVPSSTSVFHWDSFGIPTALVGVEYARQPPILVAASGAASVITYAAAGLPSGITYSATTGELAGIATDVGEYFVTLTATAGTDVLRLDLDFLVLPPSGGDGAGLATNVWISKARVRTANPGTGSWSGACVYNADRRTGRAFDPATQALSLALGASQFRVEPGTLRVGRTAQTFRSGRTDVPSISVVHAPKKQSLKWNVRRATFTDVLPAELRQTFLVGERGYRVDALVDARGRLKVPSALRRAAFVVPKATLQVAPDGGSSLNLSFLLADPAFDFVAGQSALRVRVLDGLTPLVDRTFTELGAVVKSPASAGGSSGWQLKSTADTATASRVRKFQFRGSKGTGTILVDHVTLGASPAVGEAHLGVELTIGTRVYFTGVTFFERRTGRFSVP